MHVHDEVTHPAPIVGREVTLVTYSGLTMSETSDYHLRVVGLRLPLTIRRTGTSSNSPTGVDCVRDRHNAMRGHQPVRLIAGRRENVTKWEHL